MHDASREFVLVGTGHSEELKSALDEEKQRSKSLEDNMKNLDSEIKKADNLLYRLLPKSVADRLRTGEPTINLCEVSSDIQCAKF
jgi:guanylate cyclase